jgi:FlaA1/EpsC-like NDP-sugar epimerase
MELKDENNPNGDIEIVFTGLRPGEKLYEELLIGDNVSATEHKQILRAQEIYLPKNILDEYLEHLQKAYSDNDVTALKKILQNAISGYIPEKNVSDIILKQKEK